MEKSSKKRKTKVKGKIVFLSVLLGVILYLIAIGIGLYVFNANNTVVQLTYKFIPYPAAIIGNEVVTVGELQERVIASRRFYENQDFSDLGARVDFSTPDGEKRLKIREKYIITKMIEDKIIKKEASQLGIKVSASMVSEEVEKKLEEYGTKEEVKKDIAKLYGWTLEDFKEKIVLPDIYKEKLYSRLRESDASFVKSREKISAAWKELEAGKNFAEVAERYSEGESAKSRGDLGWFRENEMLPEISQAAFSLDKGKRSKVLESRLGYHIIEIEDKQKEEGVEKVHVKQIFVRTATLADWLREKEKKYKIYIPAKDYYWDRENNQAEFSREELRRFEENLDKNSPDDISVLF